MKLLYDQNLSPRLVSRLADLYPGSAHVSHVGLGQGQDLEVWQFARTNGYFIVSKDSDFSEISLVRGFPPKVVWIRRGNCSTRQIEAILRQEYGQVIHLAESDENGILILC